MNYLKHILPITFLCFCIHLSAQSPQLLQAEGKIPKEFITQSTTKYKKQLSKLKENKTKRKDKKDKKQFYLESSFQTDDILQSGLVLFNDPASVYVNKVLEKLPYKDRKLKNKKPRAYILNSSAVNAFATDQGIIFVTLGLLANLQNEAQLAFILSHELVHIKHRHSINKFIKSKDIDGDGGKKSNVDKIALDRSIFKKSMYSRKLEEEADKEGLDIFLDSQYDPHAILNTFKILYYSYLPFEDFVFEKSFFEDEYFAFPADYWLETVNNISPMEENSKEEKKSSHPSSSKRLKKLQARIGSLEKRSKKAFLLPESEFKSIQANARYQIPFLNLYTENFPEAIYTSYLMLKEYPGDPELKKVIGKALYMDAKYRNSPNYSGGTKEEMAELAEKIEGESQQLYHLFGQLSDQEMTILALKYNWNIYQQNQDDEELNLLINDLFVEFAEHYGDLDDFQTKTKTTNKATPKKDKPSKELSKYDKIAQKSEEPVFWQFAFVKELKSDDFKKQYKKGLAKFRENEEKSEYYETLAGIREFDKKEKNERKKGKALGIKKIVVVNPFYLSLDAKKDEPIQYIRSEEKQAAFRKSLKDLANTAKVRTTVLDVTDLSRNDIEKFNDIAEVNHYFSQQMDHYDLSLTPGYNQNQVNAIAKKYGTDYFLWTGVISLNKEKKGKWAYVAASLILPYALPFTLANALVPDYDMLYYAILFDVKTGRRSIIKMDYYNKRDSKTILNAHIYDVFHQISN